ncbi:MAG: hypothetical protein LBR69_03165 [Endomicrobium sp.]|jgi:hypothetical protein|nr:hypothetical protein [Endomicrobium sp.]
MEQSKANNEEKKIVPYMIVGVPMFSTKQLMQEFKVKTPGAVHRKLNELLGVNRIKWNKQYYYSAEDLQRKLRGF